VRVALVVLTGLAFSAGAAAAPPAVVATATPATGVGPAAVSLSASGDPAGYTWDLGDGTGAAGATVRHVYAPGRYVAVVTAVAANGETSRAQVEIFLGRRTVILTAPRVADYDRPVVLGGILLPAVVSGRIQIYRDGTYVTSARVRADGRFRALVRLRAPGRYQARYGAARSAPRPILVRPRLETSLATTAAVGSRLTVVARLVPARAGALRVDLRRGDRLIASKRAGSPLRHVVATAVAGTVRAVVSSTGRPGFLSVRRSLATSVVLPVLSLGSEGPSVLALERRLAELRYALRGADSVYATDTFEAVMAFQKIHRIARTGRVDAGFWRLLARAGIPAPRVRGFDHIEVDKTRQVLLDVRGGEVERVVHVSTGATGNTPLGTWRVYRKVTGFDWVLWYPMYFLRGFAIHGYPSVPAYPASHGCVRVPMWIAPELFAGHPHGATVTIYH
jgi:L,D-transpeptidase catalytic domain/PKD domain/Putative peptidoglycan binding domain